MIYGAEKHWTVIDVSASRQTAIMRDGLGMTQSGRQHDSVIMPESSYYTSTRARSRSVDSLDI